MSSSLEKVSAPSQVNLMTDYILLFAQILFSINDEHEEDKYFVNVKTDNHRGNNLRFCNHRCKTRCLIESIELSHVITHVRTHCGL